MGRLVDEAAVVLEDDAVLDDDFPATCADAIRNAPEDWDLIHLSANGNCSATIL